MSSNEARYSLKKDMMLEKVEMGMVRLAKKKDLGKLMN